MTKDEKDHEKALAMMKRLVPKGYSPLDAWAKATDAWLGIDSLHGRYRFGTGSDEVPQGVVEPKQCVYIIERAWSSFRGERLFVHRSCASDFLIRQVFVGNLTAGPVNSTPIITEPFAVDFDQLAAIKWNEDSHRDRPIKIAVDRKAIEFLGAPFALPAFNAGLDLSFEVEHIGKEPRRFLAAFLGKTLR